MRSQVRGEDTSRRAGNGVVIEYRGVGVTVNLGGTKGVVARGPPTCGTRGDMAWHVGGSCGQLELLPLQYSEKEKGHCG